MNCGDCILLLAALRNRRSRLLFANYIRAFRAFPRSKNLTAVYAYRKAQETQYYARSSARTSNLFSVMFFRKTRKMSADVQAYFKRNLTQYSGNSAPNLKSFFGDVFSQDKENKRRRTSVLRAKFDAVFGELSPKPQIIFRRCFFRKTRKMSADVQAYSERNLTQYSGNSAPNLSSFFGDVFSQDKASKPPLYMHTARRKKCSFTGNSARTSAHFSAMFFRKTRLLSRRCIYIPQGARNEVLRKNSPKNQISIMSASFFFAISSISLTYLSVIF